MDAGWGRTLQHRWHPTAVRKPRLSAACSKARRPQSGLDAAPPSEGGARLAYGTLPLSLPKHRPTVQAWAFDDYDEDDDNSYQEITCLACAQAHLVNPKTSEPKIDSAMSRAEVYRAKSLECLQTAQRANDPAAKASFLELAEQWRELADRVDAIEREQRQP
jgi:hypothetical protein